MKYLLFLIPTLALALTPYQKQVMSKVYAEAKKHTRYPTTIAAICMTESSLGADKDKIGDDGSSYGVMQIQLKTVRWLSTVTDKLKIVKSLSDWDIKVLLLTDIEFSTMVASLYFEHYRKHWGYFKAISIYNGGTKNYRYYRKVEKHKKIIRSVKLSLK